MQEMLRSFSSGGHVRSSQAALTRVNFISNVHILPEPGTSLKFTNWKFITMAPCVIYADLESVLAEVDITHGKTHIYQKHKCCLRPRSSARLRWLK